MVSKKAGSVRFIWSVLAMAGAVMISGNAFAECKFVASKAGNAPFVVKSVDGDSPEAKEFLETCINPYTKKAVADPEVAKLGKKKFGFYSCTQCHGGNAGGQTGPSIIDDNWQYSKHVTDKGLFETIAAGTDAGMPAWHQQPSGNPELLSTDDVLKIIGWLRASYAGKDQSKEWLK